MSGNLIHLLWLALLTVYAKLLKGLVITVANFQLWVQLQMETIVQFIILIKNVFSDHLDESLLMIIVITVSVLLPITHHWGWLNDCIFPKGNHGDYTIIIQKVVVKGKQILHELCCLVYCYVDCTSLYFLAIHCCNFAYCCCNRYWWCFFPKKYTLKFINIQYAGVWRIKTIIHNCNRFHCRIYSQMCELLIGMLTLMNFLKR